MTIGRCMHFCFEAILVDAMFAKKLVLDECDVIESLLISDKEKRILIDQNLSCRGIMR